MTAITCAASCTGASAPATVAPEVDGRLTINEIMAANVLTAKDDAGVASPWIEIYNPTAEPIALGGYALTDDPSLPRKAVLPKGVAVPAGGHLVVWCDGRPEAGPAHVSIALAPAGGNVALARPDGTFIDRIAYGAQAVDLSASREPDGSDKWVIEWLASPGAANQPGDGNPVALQAQTDPPEAVPAAGDLTEQILGYDVIPSLELQIPDGSMASLRAQPTAWTPATVVYRGRSYGPVGVRLKGMRSFAPIDEKAAFRVNMEKFANGARFFGIKELTLNNMHTDLSMMHERLGYWLARQVGLTASRSNHLLLSVNGQLYGLFANVETPDKEMLQRWYPAPLGPLYEIQYVDFVPNDVANFKLSEGTDDRTLIAGLAAALTNPSPDQAMAAAAAYADVHELARAWALSAVVGQFDSNWPYAATGEAVGGDALTYDDPSTNRLEFIIAAMDDTFDTADFDFTKTASLLSQTCRKSPACYQDFVNQTWEIVAKVEQLDWAAEHDRIAAQIAPYVSMDTRKPYSDADVAMFQQQMRYFITGRETYLQKLIPPPTE